MLASLLIEKIVESMKTAKLNKMGKSRGELEIASFFVCRILMPHKTNRIREPKTSKAILFNSKKSVVIGRKNIGTKKVSVITVESINLLIKFKFFVFMY